METDASSPRSGVPDRMLPYWHSDIAPDLAAGKTVPVTAHGNSLRALVKHLDGISDDDFAERTIPTCIPLDAEDSFKPLRPGKYLDPEAAAAGCRGCGGAGREEVARRAA